MNLAAESFIESVERFCEWSEADKHDCLEARQHLLTLMVSIPHLEEYRYAGDDEITAPRRGNEQWKRDHKHFSNLPFQYYQIIFDPHNLKQTDDSVTGDLCNDFADVFGDLWGGLELHRSGHTIEALSHWVDSYFYHWGHHASSALRALDEFYRAKQN